MIDEFEVELPTSLQALGPVEVALILGSGLSDLADGIEEPTFVGFAEIPGFPRAERTVVGHKGRLVVGTLARKRVVAFQGRIHCYQGFSAREVSYPVRLAKAMGAETLIVTNAAGGIAPELAVGDLVLISDHVNLMGDNPLVGWPGPGGRQPVRAHARRLRPRAARRSRSRRRARPACLSCPRASTSASSARATRRRPR